MQADNLIERIGLVLFSSPWRANMALMLDVSPRTLRRWIETPTSVPPRVWREISQRLTERQNFIGDLQHEAIKRGGIGN